MPEDQNRRTSSPFFWVALVIGILLFCLSLIPIRIAFDLGGREKVVGWRAVERSGAWFVQTVDAGGPAAGKLIPGDRIRAIEGDQRVTRFGPNWVLQTIPPGDSYRIQFERDGVVREEQVQVATGHNDAAVFWTSGYLFLALGLCVFAMFIALAKPEDPAGRWASLAGSACALMPLAYASAPAVGILPGFFTWAAMLMLSISPLHFASAYQFYSVFPVRQLLNRFWRNLGIAIGICGFLLWAPLTFENILVAMQNEAARAFIFRFYPLVHFELDIVKSAEKIYDALAVVAILCVVTRNFRLLPEGVERRRLRWVIWGAIVGMCPIGLVLLVTAIAGAVSDDPRLMNALAVAKGASTLTAIAIPLTIVYAIVKHRVLGINIALRLGVQYLLARNVLRVIVFLPLAGLLYSIVSHPNATVQELVLRGSGKFNLLMIALASAGLVYRRPLTALFDKRFFREAYDQEQVLLTLIESLKQADSIQEISQLLSKAIQSALHAQRICVFYREESDPDFRLVHSSDGSGVLRRISESSGMVSILGGASSAHAYAAIRKDCPPDEAAWLDELRVQLLVPVLGTGRKLLGVLTLGEKMSEEPYTRRDRKLLEAVAAQIGVVYENLALRDRVKKEQQVQAHVLAHLHESQFNLVRECPHCGACYDSDAQRCARDGYELAITLPVERTVDGKYRLDRLIGKGGMGAVYQAYDLRLNRTVAVKLMVGSLFGNTMALRRFAREAQASAKLDHRNIVRIYDFGELRGEGAYLVLEYVPGQTWRQELRDCGVFPPALAADALDQLLCGLDAAHQGGVVHRDLKPDNVLISRVDGAGSPVVKILDFGLAKLREDSSSDPHSQTVTRYMIGTFGYASPEQMLGERIDQRTDIYAVGVIALETVTGEIESRRSYQTRMQDLALRRFAFEPIHELHVAIARIIAKCLAADPELRYSSAQELRDALVPAVRACPPIPKAADEAGAAARAGAAPMSETAILHAPKSPSGTPAH